MQNVSTLPTVLTIFGATGDLTKRKLIPALYRLYVDGALPAMMHVVGFARRELTTEDFQQYVVEVLESDGATSHEKVVEFSKIFSYCVGGFTDPAGYASLATLLGMQDSQWKTCANKLFHLAVPPEYYKQILENLSGSGLTIPCGPDEGWTRVIVEKPFGKDLATAEELDLLLGKLFREEQIYRIDHYLGKDTVQNILAFRFSNVFLDPAWNARSISSVHINFTESLDVQGRGGFYDGVGALRDVGQNHMLQLLALFMMQNPGAFDAQSIRTARAKILDSLETMDAEDIVRHTLRGQYEEYLQEKGVAPDSQTETYFQVQARLSTPEWRGVPIFLRSGKALGESKVEVVVQFRHHTPCLCPDDKHLTNTLRYEIQPHEGARMSFWAKKPGGEMVVEEKEFAFDYGSAFAGSEFLDAYAKLLRDAIEGNQTSFVSTEEIRASWKFIDPIISAWQQDVVPLIQYPKGADASFIVDRERVRAIPVKHVHYIGLGKMGANMVERLVDYGWEVTAYDPDGNARKKMNAEGVKVVGNISELTLRLPRQSGVAQDQPRDPLVAWLMVPHQAVDDVLQELMPFLHEGDTVIDGGNSFYKDSIRRAEELRKIGVHYLDVGVSGGPGGARRGACLMIGGDESIYKKHVGLFSDLSLAGGYDYMGDSGAGHFVKMVHNGIEYGMMQAIAEGFSVLKSWRKDVDLERIAHIYNNGSVIESRLVHWLKEAYAKYGADLEGVSGVVAHSGEGKWTVETAKELGIPVSIIEGALQFRIESENHPSYTGKILSALRNQFGGHSVGK